jgi:hypothetical protein
VEFVARLAEGLQAAGAEVWVDLKGIRPTTEWLKEVFAAIDRATDFVFVLSPDSVTSRFCGLELDHAVNRGKRLVPVLWRPPANNTVPEALQRIQWIKFDRPDEFARSLESIHEALITDNVWVAEHTRLLGRAIEWQDRSSRLLTSRDLREAERWQAQRPPPNLNVVPLQRDYIRASRRRATWRLAIWSLASVTFVLGSSTGGTLYLRSAPLQEAEVLCTPPVLPGHRAAAISRLEWLGWVRSDERARSALVRCLSVGDLRRDPHDAPKRVQGAGILPPGLREGPNVAISAPSGETLTVLTTHAEIADQYRLMLIERGSGKIVAQGTFKAKGVAGIALAPGGLSIAVNVIAENGQQVLVFPAQLRDLTRPAGHLALDERVTYWSSPARARVAYSADGRFLAAASFAGLVKVWNTGSLQVSSDATPQAALSRQVDSNEAMAVAFAPDGARLATLGRDGMLRVFELANSAEIAAVYAHEPFVMGDRVDEFQWSEPGVIVLSGQRWAFTAPVDKLP